MAVPNNDLENWTDSTTPEEWTKTIQKSSDDTAELNRDTDSYNGTYCAKYTTDKWNSSKVELKQTIILTTELSFYAKKASGGDNDAILLFEIWDETETSLWYNDVITTWGDLTTSYQKFSLDTTTHSGGTAVVKVRLQGTVVGG